MGILESIERQNPFSRKTTLYFPGCSANKEVVAATKALLADHGVEFIMIERLACCGHEAWLAGYEQDFIALRQRNTTLLREQNVHSVITNDPHCALTFKERYNLDAQHIVEVLNIHIDKLVRHDGASVNYHHPCFLDRLGIDERAPARLLRRAGIHVTNENKPRGCCGSVGADFARNNPAKAAFIAKTRAKDFKEKLLVTCCPYCRNAFRIAGLNCKDITEVLSEHHA
jgi:Fe-S oxidoreductase